MERINNVHKYMRQPTNIVYFPSNLDLYIKLKKIIGCKTRARKLLTHASRYKKNKNTT